MISLYTGTPGSGKSLHMAKDIYWHVRMKRPVIANFEINRDMFSDASSFTYVPYEDMTPEYLEDYARNYFKDHEFKEGTLAFYWDEAQINLNSRTWKDNQHWIPFFTQHRKLGFDVYLVCQYHEMLDKQVRTLVEYEVMHRKVNNVGWFGKVVSLAAFGHPVVCAVTRWYGQRMRLSAEWMMGTQKYYRLYDTYKMFDGAKFESVNKIV